MINNKCFETIKVKDGKLQNLKYHQKRVDYTREFFGFRGRLDLNTLHVAVDSGILRLDYAQEIQSINYRNFKEREFGEFSLIESDIDYDFKYANRDELNALKKDRKEIIIVKNELLTDTSIANIALYINGNWFTPKKPLLFGTARARLVEIGFLKCKDLTIKDLEKSENFAIMNALIDFKIIKNFIIK